MSQDKSRVSKRYRRPENVRQVHRNNYQEFLETSKGPVAHKLWDLAEYNDKGELEIKPEKVKQAAKEKVEDIRYGAPQISKNELVSIVQDEAAAAGRPVSPRGAEARINRAEASEAAAILKGAELSGAKLTEAQTNRLQSVARGEYLKVVYSQYESGERGTLVGPKKKWTAANNFDTTKEAREDRIRHFYTEVMNGGSLERRSA